MNIDEEEKSVVLRKQEDHLFQATAKCSFYRKNCEESKKVAKEIKLERLEKSQPNSKDVAFHYSFDYAQQVHYPADPQQPGPIYFKTPRKCQVFGVHAAGLPEQINYLIDEAVSCGKGANGVISLVHHFLENYGIGEKHLQLSADNSSGENKNNCMLQYLCWRTMIGLSDSVYLHFMLAGHTKRFARLVLWSF